MWAQEAVQKQEAGVKVMQEARTAVASARLQNQTELATTSQWVSDRYVGHGSRFSTIDVFQDVLSPSSFPSSFPLFCMFSLWGCSEGSEGL